MIERLKKSAIILIGVVTFILLGAFCQKSMALPVDSTVHLTSNSKYTLNGNNLASRNFKLFLYSTRTAVES